MTVSTVCTSAAAWPDTVTFTGPVIEEVGIQEVVLPRVPVMVPVVRCWVRALLATWLAACPRAEDTEIVVAELAGSLARDGTREHITVTLDVHLRRIRATVTEYGPAWTVGDFAEAYRDAHDGLTFLVVGPLTSGWGHVRDFDGSHSLWAELRW